MHHLNNSQKKARAALSISNRFQSKGHYQRSGYFMTIKGPIYQEVMMMLNASALNNRASK